MARADTQAFMQDAGGWPSTSPSVPLINPQLVAVFKHYFEDMQAVYTQISEAVCQDIPGYQPPIPNLPFTSYTLNVDYQCICEPHVDGSNLAFGLCLICPFGKFDHKKGGHLVLHDLKIILEFAPGSIAFIPSALITHENIGIKCRETRHAVTAYTPASIFRYCLEDLQKSPEWSPEQKRQLGEMRWKYGKTLLPHVTQWL
jgi:hypothetical protein